jgi:hypothetical protein
VFDKQDVRLLIKATVIVVGASSLLLTMAGVIGLAFRIFGLAAG